MSSMKENVPFKSSASKNIPTRGDPIQKARSKTALNLNSTFMCLPEINTTKFKAELPSMCIHAVPTDYDLQYDIAYSNYLQALFYQQYMINQKNENELILNDQLSVHNDLLSSKFDTVNELEDKLKTHEKTNRIQELIHILNDKLKVNLNLLSPNVENSIIKIMNELEEASNHLYLNKVKTLYDQNECDHLQSLLSRTDKILSTIITLSGDTEKYKILNDCLQCTKTLLEEVSMSKSTINAVQADKSKSILENISDILFQYK